LSDSLRSREERNVNTDQTNAAPRPTSLTDAELRAAVEANGISSDMLLAGALRSCVEKLRKVCPGLGGYAEPCCSKPGQHEDELNVIGCPKSCQCHE
jgi:hypothetical protein